MSNANVNEPKSNKRSSVRYPPVSTCVGAFLWQIRGCFLAALFSVYVLHPVLECVLPWTLQLPPVQWAVSAAAGWLDDKTRAGSARDTLVFSGLMLACGCFQLLLTAVTHTFDHFELFQSYRLPRTKRMAQPPGLVTHSIQKTVGDVLFGSPPINAALFLLIARFPSLFRNPSDLNDYRITDPASLENTFFHLVASLLVNEVALYTVHRALHHPRLYACHKMHHQFVATVGSAASYMHATEALVNVSAFTGYLVFMSDRIDQRIWYTYLLCRFWDVVEAHGGYCFTGTWADTIGLTWGARAAFHDWHHSDNRGNYGCYWMDYLFGTMDTYAQLLADGGHEGRAKQKKLREN